MGIVVTFSNYRPMAREDGQAWVSVEIEESVDALGPWTLIDTITLSPVDSDPANPQDRSFTTAAGTLQRGWYRAVFVDALGNREFTEPLAYPPGASASSGGLSIEDLKRRLDLQKDADNDVLQDYLDSAFLQAQAPPPYGCGRVLVPDPPENADPAVERALTPTGRRRRWLVPDARELDTITIDGNSTSDYRVERRNGLIVALSFARGLIPWDIPSSGYGFEHVDPRTWQDPPAVAVTGRFGFAALPDNLRDAIYVLAARSYYERAALYADNVAVGEGAKAETYYRQLPPRVKLVFATYALPSGHAGLA